MLGPYRIEGTIGRGGMASVFAAVHSETHQMVALKVLRPELIAQAAARKRFIREAKAAGSIRHPHIVQILDAGLADGDVPYIAMERLHGESLHDVLSLRRALPYQEALEYLAPVMEALVVLHGRGMIHRDLKPSNIFLSRAPDGVLVPKLLDFGIVKVLSDDTDAVTENPIGTLHYMSPEQIQSPLDVRPSTDVWAMGVMLYRCLTGHLPFVGEGQDELLTRILDGDVRPIPSGEVDAPPQLIQALARALDRDLDHRYRDMGGFLRALHATRALRAPPMGGPSPARPEPPQPPGNRGLAAAVFGLVALLSLGALFAPRVMDQLRDLWPSETREEVSGPTGPVTVRVPAAPAKPPRPPSPVAPEPEPAATEALGPIVEPTGTPAPEPAGPPGTPVDSGVDGATRATRLVAARRAYDEGIEARGDDQPRQARAAFDRALELAPRFVAAYAARSELRLSHGDEAGALADAEQALSIEPGRPELHDAHGRAALALGRVDQAIEDFERAHRARPTETVFAENLVAALFERARSRQTAGDQLGARHDLDRVLELDEGHPLALRRRGLLLIELGERPAGKRDLERYLLARPNARDRTEIARMLAL